LTSSSVRSSVGSVARARAREVTDAVREVCRYDCNAATSTVGLKVATCAADDFGGRLTGESKYSVCSAASVLALVSSCCANTEPAPPDVPVRVDMLNSRTLCCAFASKLRSDGSSSSIRNVGLSE
ncbi:hypothetical protein KCV05_g112, partial [Aureobasidium melanogenum]